MPMSINRKSQTPLFLAPGEGKSVTTAGIISSVKLSGEQSGGKFAVIEGVEPPKSGPPPRWHKKTTLFFYILEGTFEITIGEDTFQAGPGSCGYIPPRTVYTWLNVGETLGKFLVVCHPSGIEDYSEKVFELSKTEASWPPKDMSRYLQLAAQYDILVPPVDD